MPGLHRSLQVTLWAFAVVYVVINALQITQIDVWWQLAEGLRILHAGTLPTAPVAAFGIPANPYFDEYAGYEIVLAAAFKLGGFTAIWLAFAAVYLAILLLPSMTPGRGYPALDFVSTTALVFAAVMMKERMEQRPEMIGALLLVLLMITLRGTRLSALGPGSLAALFAIFFAWTNAHSSFVVGLFVLALWIGCEWAQGGRADSRRALRNALLAGGVALLALMLNPHGPRRLLFPFEQIADPGSTVLSLEMWPVTDLTSISATLIIVPAALMLWGVVTTRGVPLWLILFSIVSVLMAFHSFRFVNFTAIALLFIYAQRRDDARAKARPGMLTLLRSVGLAAACLFLLVGDGFFATSAYGELRGEVPFAKRTDRYVPALSATRVSETGVRVPVLCGYCLGSYLSFPGNSQFRPLLDSGMSHFTSDSKRYYFFCWQKPEAFASALEKLRADYVLVNKETFQWVPTLHRAPGWTCVACTADGMLWKRDPAAVPLTPQVSEDVQKAIQDLRGRGEIFTAFAYSTLLDDPPASMRLLSKFRGPDWSDGLFNSVCAWADSVSPEQIRAYLASNHPRQYPLVDAILAERAGPADFAKFLATDPAGPRPWFWKVLVARDCLQRGDISQARAVFESIRPVPPSSVAYYELRSQLVRVGAQPDDALGAYGRWQTWDADGPAFMAAMSRALNERLESLDRPSP